MATKMERLERTHGANARESMGATRLNSGRGVAKAPPSTIPIPTASGRMKGLSMLPDAAVIPLRRIVPDADQPRKEFDDESLQALAESLRTRGQLLPIRVRYHEELDSYLIICGERRWRAAHIAGLASLACVVHDGPVDAGELLIDQLVENCVREDLRPMEQAEAYRSVMASRGWSGRQLAKELGISQAAVSRALALIGLAEEVKARVDAGEIPAATAWELSKIKDPAEQVALSDRVVSEGLSRSEVGRVIHRESPRKLPRGVMRAGPANWRAVPITGIPLARGLMKALIDTEVDTAGEAWAMVENGALVDVHEFSEVDVKLIEGAIVALREEAGDPAPCTLAMPEEAWRSKHLAEDAELSYKATEAARLLGIQTFGELDDRYRQGVKKETFGSEGLKLWAALQGVKGYGKRSPYAQGDGRDVPGRPQAVPAPARTVSPIDPLPPWGPAAFTDRKECVLADVEGVQIVARADDEESPWRVLIALKDAIARVEASINEAG